MSGSGPGLDDPSGDLSYTDVFDQAAYAAFDVVADGSDGGEVQAGGIVEVVLGFVALAREDGAGIAAAHADHDVGGSHGLIGPRLGEPG
jgi:hypothetical protein